MKKLFCTLAFLFICCCAARGGAAEDAAAPESGRVAPMRDYGVTLVIPSEYEQSAGDNGYWISFLSEDMEIGVAPTSYTDMEAFRAALKEMGMDILSEKTAAVNNISVAVLTPDPAAGRCAIAVLQSEPGGRLLALDFLPVPDGGLDSGGYEERVNRVLQWIRRPQDALEGDLSAFNAYLQGSASQAPAYAPQIVSFDDLGCGVVLPGSMVKRAGNINNEAAAYENEFVSVYFFVYDGWTVSAYENYAGVNQPDYALTENQVNGIDMRFYEYIGDDEAEPVAATALYDAGKGKKLEMVFIPAFKDQIDENWLYISLIANSVNPYSAGGEAPSTPQRETADLPEAARQAALLGGELFDFYEALLQAEKEASSSIVQYEENGDYASLLAARRRAGGAVSPQAPEKIPEIFYSIQLESMGVDPSLIDNLLLSPCGAQLSMLNSTLAMQYDFIYSSYFSHRLTSLASGRASCFLAYFDTLARMQPYVFFLVFQGIMEEPALADFWQSIPERWPNVGASLPAQMDGDTASSRLADLTAALSRLADLEAMASDSYTAGKNQLADEYASGRIDASRKEDYYLPERMPLLIPLPDKWLDAMPASPWDGREGQDFTLALSGVGEEEFLAYMRVLLPQLSPEAEMEGRAGEGWSYRNDALKLLFSWNPDGTAVIQYDPALATVEKLSTAALLMAASH